jgi:hypothetical protein
VYHPSVLPVAPGEKLRITRNGKTTDGRHDLNNGALYTVAGFTPDGDIRLSNGWTVSKDYGFLAHGYVVTSHAAQGRTVNHVFIAQSERSYPASSREQWYVSISRGRHAATVYAADKESLLEAVSRSDDRLAATDLFSPRKLRERAEHGYRAEQLAPVLAEASLNREELIHER